MSKSNAMRELAARTFALAICAKDQRLIASLCAQACEYVGRSCRKSLPKLERDPAIARDFLDMERRRLSLARSYQSTNQLQSFSNFPQQVSTPRLSGLWPVAILGLGLVLTIAWNVMLCWLLYTVL
jgi:hypothetical protein